MVKLKPLWTLLKLLLLIFLVMVIFAAVYLRQGERTLDWAEPIIAKRINNSELPYDVTIGRVSIDWRDLSKFGLLRVQKVTLSGKDGAVFAMLPEMYVSLDPLGFLPHRRSLNTVLIQKPKLFLTRGKDNVLRLGLDTDASAMPMGKIGGGGEEGEPWSGQLPFRHLRVEHSNLVFHDEVSGQSLTSTDATLVVNRSFGRYDAGLRLPFTDGRYRGYVLATLQTPEYNRNRLNLRFANLPIDYACVIATCPEGTQMSGHISGQANLALNNALKPQSGTAQISSANATFTAPQWFPETIKIVKESAIEIAAGDAMRRIKVTKTSLHLVDTHIVATADATKKEDGWYVQATAVANRLNIRKLYKYWPIHLASDTRTWVNENLPAGYGEQASIRLNLKPSDFTNETISDEALESTIQAKNITVNYLPGFPVLKNVNGVVKFTGHTMEIHANSGTMLTGTQLSSVIIKCPDLNNPATPMEIETVLKAPAADAATILALKHFVFDDALKLDPATLKGTVEGSLKFLFDAFSKDRPGAVPVADGEISFDNVQYDIDTKLTDVAQPNFMGKMNIQGASGTLSANNDGMMFDGSVVVGGTTNVKINVSQNSGEDVLLKVDGTVARDQFTALGLPDDKEHFGEGNLKINAELTAKKEAVLLRSGSVDLTDMAFFIPEISWQKARGEAASMKLVPKGEAFGLDIAAKDLSIPNATLSLTPELDVQSLNLPSVKAGNSDFSMSYKTRKDGFDVNLSGKRIDNSASYQNSEGGLLGDFPPIHLKMDLGELILVPGSPLRNLEGTLHCNEQRCESANITAMAGDGAVTGTISRVNGKRQFNLTSTNAGDLLRAVDITDRMYGGKLEMKGDYNDGTTPPTLPARLLITDFRLKNSQILGRILSIASLSGLLNALTGNGIDFEKLGADITSQGGKIKIADGKASGAALGITIEGNVDTTVSTLNMRGVVVPAFMLNTLVGKLPLIGKLAGGEEGLIAFNFSVKGPYKDPDVSVNPFSGLTPGFLRGIWGSNKAGEAPIPPKEGEAKPAPTPPAEPKANWGTRRHQQR